MKMTKGLGTIIRYFLSGIVIGVANIIPGVSGGTMAVILGIYDKLINAISLNLTKLKKNLPFIISIGLGMGAGISLLARLLTYLFENYNVPTQFFFIGLIGGSIPLVWRLMTEEKKLAPINIIPFLITLGIMIAMAMLQENENVIATTLTMELAITLVGSGAVASFAMLIPGISGSFLLKAMGQYETISAAASFGEFNIPILIPVGIGVLIGLLLGAKLISILLKKFKQGIYSAIMGLIIGSIIEIYPREFMLNSQGFIAITVMIIGFFIPTITEQIGKKDKN